MLPLTLPLFLAVPGPPFSVDTSEVTARSAVISWKPPMQSNGNIKFYQVFLSQADENESRHSVKSYESSLTLTSLKPYTTYQFQVIAVNIRTIDNQMLKGRKSNVNTFTTSQSGTYRTYNIILLSIPTICFEYTAMSSHA